MLSENVARGIALHIIEIFSTHRETRCNVYQFFSGSGSSPQINFQLLFGSATDIRVEVFKERITIQPMGLEEKHMPAWCEILDEYLHYVVVPAKTMGVFLQ